MKNNLMIKIAVLYIYFVSEVNSREKKKKIKFFTINLFSNKSHMKFFSSINLAFLQYSNSLIVAIEKEGLQNSHIISHKIVFYFYLKHQHLSFSILINL
jgi:hypothetical protein